MNLLFFTDPHLRKKELEECKLVLDEIIDSCNLYKIDIVYDLGDTFDSYHPEANCLDLFSEFVKKLERPIFIIAAQSHESTTEKSSILNHFGILNSDQIEIAKFFIDSNILYCGHQIINESKKNYGGTIAKKDLEKYTHVLLGHGHNYEKIDNIIQLGSCRFIDFGEDENNPKRIAVCFNYKDGDEKWSYPVLKSPIPMKTLELSQNPVNRPSIYPIQAKIASVASSCVKSVEEMKVYLDNLAPKTKIRVIIKDYTSYLAFLNVAGKYEQKFVLFKYETDFDAVSVSSQKCILKETKSFEEIFLSWLDKQNLNDKVKEILLNEFKVYKN